MNIQSAINYCSNVCRSLEYEYYLVGFFSKHRHLLSAVWAFNAETALRRYSNEDTAIGRITFWKECLHLLRTSNERNIEHPVYKALKYVYSKYPSLDISMLRKVLETREKDIKVKTYYTMGDVEEYSEGTNGSLLCALLSAINMDSIQTNHVTAHLGKALGISHLINSLRSNHMLIPQEILTKFKISQSQAERGIRGNDLTEITYEMSRYIKQHLNEAVNIWNAIAEKDNELRLILLPITLKMRMFLNRLDNAEYDEKGLINHQDGFLPLKVLFHAKFSSKL